MQRKRETGPNLLWILEKARARSSDAARTGKARARSGEAARGRLRGSSSSKVRQRGEGSGTLRWSPGGGDTAGLDRSGGEKRGDGVAETERKRREKGVVYKGRPLVPGDG